MRPCSCGKSAVAQLYSNHGYIGALEVPLADGGVDVKVKALVGLDPTNLNVAFAGSASGVLVVDPTDERGEKSELESPSSEKLLLGVETCS